MHIEMKNLIQLGYTAVYTLNNHKFEENIPSKIYCTPPVKNVTKYIQWLQKWNISRQCKLLHREIFTSVLLTPLGNKWNYKFYKTFLYCKFMNTATIQVSCHVLHIYIMRVCTSENCARSASLNCMNIMLHLLAWKPTYQINHDAAVEIMWKF
jgi:hypothetical protein